VAIFTQLFISLDLIAHVQEKVVSLRVRQLCFLVSQGMNILKEKDEREEEEEKERR
jgi:hypothetical protein